MSTLCSDLVARLGTELGGVLESSHEYGTLKASESRFGVPIEVRHALLEVPGHAARLAGLAGVLAGAPHPHLVRVLAAGKVGEVPYYVVPDLGEDLDEAVFFGSRLETRRIVAVLRDAAEAVAHMHAQGYVLHCISPLSLRVHEGRGVLYELPCARPTNDSPESGEGYAIGNPSYLSPEVVRGDPYVDWRTDVYSLGVTTYACVTGEAPPWSASTSVDLVVQITTIGLRVRAPSSDWESRLFAAVTRATAIERDGRYASVADFAAELGHLL